MRVKNLITINNFFILFILIFSIIVNQHYASLGAFPIDTFYHYDSAFRILNNEYPIRDYWVVAGFIGDFFQCLNRKQVC